MASSPRIVIDKIYFSWTVEAEELIESNLASNTRDYISHVLCVGRPSSCIKHLEDVQRLFVNPKKDSIPNKFWITKFPATTNFIEQGTSENSKGIWIIGDQSISKLVIAAYLISKEHCSAGGAVCRLSSMKLALLPEEFFSQLQLWATMGGKIDKTSPQWITYQKGIEKENTDALLPRVTPSALRDCQSRLEGAKQAYKKGQLDLFSLPSLGQINWGYCCNTCDARLFCNQNILKHTPTNFQPVLNENYPCNAVSIEPLRWMDSIKNDSAGLLHCYSCGTVVGSWHWGPTECPWCNNELSAAFLITLRHLTYISPRVQPRRRRSDSTMLTAPIIKFFAGDKKKNGTTTPVNSPVEANSYEQLPDHIQKVIRAAKISTEDVNANWTLCKNIIHYCSKVRVTPRDFTNDEFHGRLHDLIEGITVFCKDTEFGTQIPKLLDEARNKEYASAREHPVISGYINFATHGKCYECTIPLVDCRIPNYIDLAAETFLNDADPRTLFKLEKHKEGRGKFGRVYVAKHRESKKKIAMKKMDHTDEYTQARNYKEIAILANCSHPNIASAYDCYQIENELWIAMEYLEGGTLHDLSGLYQFKEIHIAFIARECLKALQYLSEIGIAHRDLKPDNIMLTDKFEVKLIDFGLSDSIVGMEQHPKMAGSASYMSPEMIYNVPQTFQVDVWSLGCTLYQLIDSQGFRAYRDGKFNCLFNVAVKGRSLNPEKLSPKCCDFLKLMLQRRPENRGTPEQLLEHPFLQSPDISSSCMTGPVNFLLGTRDVFKT